MTIFLGTTYAANLLINGWRELTICIVRLHRLYMFTLQTRPSY